MQLQHRNLFADYANGLNFGKRKSQNALIQGDDYPAYDAPDLSFGSAFDTAQNALGLDESGKKAALQDYLETGGINIDPATRAWCADFVNATLAQSGGQGTGSGMARSFLDWGNEVDTPQQGDVAVFSRGNPTGPSGHVGFFDSYNDDGSIRVLGGNQSDSVSYGNYPANSLLSFRRG